MKVLKLNYNLKSDRLKLFFTLLVLFFGASFFFMYLSGFFDSPEVVTSGESKPSEQKKFDVNKQERNSAGRKDLNTEKVLEDSKASLTAKDNEESQRVAVSFIKAYYNYDINEPIRYPDNAKKFMSEQLFESERKYVRREKENHKAISTEILPVDHFTPGEVMWSVVINSSIKDQKQEYFVTLKPFADEWKVIAFSLEGDGH